MGCRPCADRITLVCTSVRRAVRFSSLLINLWNNNDNDENAEVHYTILEIPAWWKAEENSVSYIYIKRVALVRERTMPTERPPLVGEVVPTLRIEGVAWSAQRIPTVVNLDFLDRSRYSVVLTRLSGPRSRSAASQKIWKRLESNTWPLDL
jgi:hypothetical protein